jgi:hypothetical protein
MALAEESAPDVHSLDYADSDAVRAFLTGEHATPHRLETFIGRLQRGVICPWCCRPLRASPDCPDPLDDAGAVDWLPETVIEGVRRGTARRFYCDRSDCAKSGLVDGPAPGESRARGQLHAHCEHLLDALGALYPFDLAADRDAAHDALETAISDDANGGQDRHVLACGLAGALE